MAKKIIITIGREFGSGGRFVGQSLAKQLDIPYYDKELLTLAAQTSGINEELIQENDENTENSFLNYFSVGDYSYDLPLNNKVFLAEFETIKKIADEGSCVIVGRCADYVLAEYPECINVFIHANMKDRIAQIMKDHADLTSKQTEELITKTDKKRMRYYEFYTGKTWSSVDSYHLTIDSSVVGVQGASSMVLKFIELKKDRKKI